MLRRIFFYFTALISLCVGGVVYFVAFSTMPFRLLDTFAEKHGIEIEGVAGTLSTGLTFEVLRFHPGTVEVEMRDLKLNYSSAIVETILERKLIIKSLESKKVTVRLPAQPDFSPLLEKSAAGSAAAGAVAVQTPTISIFTNPLFKLYESPQNSKGLTELRIQQMRFENVTLVWPKTMRPIEMREFKIDGTTLTPQKLGMEFVAVDGALFTLNVKGLAIDSEHIQSTTPFAGSLRTEFAKDFLKRDIEFKAVIATSGRRLSKLEVSAFDERVKIKKMADNWKIEVSAFNPIEYFAVELPLAQIAFDAQLPTPTVFWKGGALPLKGSFKLGDAPFAFDATGAVGEAFIPIVAHGTKSNLNFKVTMNRNVFAETASPASGTPWLELGSDTFKYPEQAGSTLLFGIDFANSTAESRAQIEKNLTFFKRTDPAVLTTLLAKAPDNPFAIQVKPSALRSPASEADAEVQSPSKEAQLNKKKSAKRNRRR